MFLDATTQPGFLGTPIVMLAGNGLVANGLFANGLDLASGSDGSTIRGMAIDGFGEAGIDIEGNSNSIQGNFLGTDISGDAAGPGNQSGVDINGGSNNTIGGSTAIERLTSSRATQPMASRSAELRPPATSWPATFGTDINGAQPLPNYAGVEIDFGANGNTIGTNGDGVSDSLERNIISGNLFAGVWIVYPGTDNNIVAGNYIGTNRDGTGSIGNGSETLVDPFNVPESGGVVIDGGASNNVVGTNGSGNDDTGQRNVISGNLADGVDIEHSGTSGNVLAGNFIGTNASGTAALANKNGDGVFLAELDSVNWIGVNKQNNHSAENADQANLISGNRGNGVDIYDSTRIVVAGNLIGTDFSGSIEVPNLDGIRIADSSEILVGTSGQDGSDDAIRRNIISGNSRSGVLLFDDGVVASGTQLNVVAGNDVGTTASGDAPLGNGFDGIDIGSGASHNWIGVNSLHGPENSDKANVIGASGALAAPLLMLACSYAGQAPMAMWWPGI